jgi:hypothetical protein
LGFDLRLAFHCQDLDSFIEDMVAQSFDFIHCCYPTRTISQFRVASMLEMGGMAVFSHPDSQMIEEEMLDDIRLHKWEFDVGGNSIKLVTKGSIIRRRRGGRARTQ